MRLLAFFAAGALAVHGAAGAAPTDLASGFKVITRDGGKEALFQLYHWRLQRNGDAASSPIDLILVTLDDKDIQARVQPALKRGSAVSLYTPSLCPGAVIMTNGSFYTRDGEKSAPLGLVRSRGKTLARLSQRRSGGFLVINGGKVGILPRSATAKALTATDAIESSPIVVREGANDMRSDDGVRFDRVGVGTASTGKTIVVGAFAEDQDSISLFEFSTLARAAVVASGSGGRLNNLLAMDGGPSAHIYLPRTGRLYGYRGPAYLPNAICIGRR